MRQSVIISIFFTYVVLCSLIVITTVKADVLSADQKAPPFARGSGLYALQLPFEEKPNVKQPVKQPAQQPVKQPAKQPTGNNENEVQREDVTSFKKVGDETIIVVEGSLGYKSPEGLAISVNYKADENGNHASFKFGTGSPGSSSSQKSQTSQASKVSQPAGGGGNKGGGGSDKNGGGGNKGGGGSNKGGGAGDKGGVKGINAKSAGDGSGERTYLPPPS